VDSDLKSENSEPELILTDNAIQQVKRLLARDHHEEFGLRVSVANGGCSGFSYQLKFEKEPTPADIVLVRDGLNVYVDKASAPYLRGTVIDFAAGIYGGGFKFTNPNATGTCGCGTSFSA
jgi:iron-sulfur cluster assembly accessory protein